MANSDRRIERAMSGKDGSVSTSKKAVDGGMKVKKGIDMPVGSKAGLGRKDIGGKLNVGKVVSDGHGQNYKPYIFGKADTGANAINMGPSEGGTKGTAGAPWDAPTRPPGRLKSHLTYFTTGKK